MLAHLTSYWERREAETGNHKWVRVIYDRESKEPYLIRYFLLSTRWIDSIPIIRRLFWWASFRLTLHRTLRSDIDGFHDHPWPWASLILSGGYWEDAPAGCFWRAPGSLRFRSAEALHRLVLDPDTRKEVWSLFFMGPRQRDWGFVDRTGRWVQWEEYLRNRGAYVAQ